MSGLTVVVEKVWGPIFWPFFSRATRSSAAAVAAASSRGNTARQPRNASSAVAGVPVNSFLFLTGVA